MNYKSMISTDMYQSLDEPRVNYLGKSEHFGEPAGFCQINDILNFLRTQIPRSQKSLNAIWQYCIQVLGDDIVFFGLVFKPGVDFINCFVPYSYLLHLAPNFCASKKLLKSYV